MKQYLALAAGCLSAIAAAQSSSSGCSSDVSDVFNIVADFDPQETTPVTPPSTLPTCTGIPVLSLKSGSLTDQVSRVCEIVYPSHQFQCDPAPGQPGATTSGWQACDSPSQQGVKELQIKGSGSMYLCASKDPSDGHEFFNIYDDSLRTAGPVPAQCKTGTVKLIPCSNSSSPVTPVTPAESSGSAAVEAGASGNTMEEPANGGSRKRAFHENDAGLPLLLPAPAKRDYVPAPAAAEWGGADLEKRVPFPLNKGGKMWWPMQERRR